jgi:hypothetical protein
MNRFLQFPVLLSMLLSTACMAAEPSMCKSICAEEKQACRASARHQSDLDHNPGIEMTEGNRDARALGKLQDTPQEAKKRELSDFQKRKMEREQACDGKAMACSRACSRPPAQPSSVVLKPRPQQE